MADNHVAGAREFVDLPSLTVENYVKAIYNICTRLSGKPATTGAISDELGVSPGTVTSMLKGLREQGYATYEPYEGVTLSDAGRELALRILRRHRLIELFLTKSLGLGWDEVHEDAEHMEHVISDFLIERIDGYLGHPKFDPHGDPIPAPDGSLVERRTESLDGCQPGEPFVLARVLDQSPEFLRYLQQSGIPLGAQGTITENRQEAGVVTVLVDGSSTTLGYEAARKLLVVRSASAKAHSALSDAQSGQ